LTRAVPLVYYKQRYATVADSQRQLHIRIPSRLHRALRLHAAAEDKTIQELVVEVLSKELAAKPLEEDDNLAEGGFNDE
jgi:hypothetical protein